MSLECAGRPGGILCTRPRQTTASLGPMPRCARHQIYCMRQNNRHKQKSIVRMVELFCSLTCFCSCTNLEGDYVEGLIKYAGWRLHGASLVKRKRCTEKRRVRLSFCPCLRERRCYCHGQQRAALQSWPATGSPPTPRASGCCPSGASWAGVLHARRCPSCMALLEC